MTLNYADADTQQFAGGELIPTGTLAKAIINVKHGQNTDPNTGVTESMHSDSKYLDLDIIISEGPYTKRHIFTKIGVAGSEKWVNMGRAQIRAILEYGRGASASNLAAYQINSLNDLHGLPCAIKVGIEKDKAGQHPDKNSVVCFLSPNPDSSTFKDFEKLQKGETAASHPAANTTAPAVATAPASNKPAWL